MKTYKAFIGLILVLFIGFIAHAESQCPQSFIDHAKWDGTDIYNGMPVNQSMCSQMPGMTCCKEFFEHQSSSRPKRKHIAPEDLAPFPAKAPNLSTYEKMGYCSGEIKSTSAGQVRHYEVDASDRLGFFQFNIKTERDGKIYNCPAFNFPSVKEKNRPINGPPLFFVNGETAEIVVKNTGKTPTSVHWHGLELDNAADGVPGVTQPPIMPGESYVYRFKIHQDGTYWYHPHTLQEQQGRGPFIIFPKNSDPVFNNPDTKYHHDQVLLLTDHLKADPEQILANLQHESGNMQTDGKIFNDLWTAYKTEGKKGFQRAFENLRSMGMFSMDKADVYYSNFFINDEACLNCGKNPTNSYDQSQLYFGNVKAGERIRLRIINGSTSSYFYLDYANNDKLDDHEKLPITIVSKDGKNVQPVEVDQLYMGMGECYDVILEVPESKKGYELRLKSIDDQFNKRLARVIIGENTDNKNIQTAKDVKVTTFGEVPNDGTVQVNYDMLKALNPAPIDPSIPVKYLEFEVVGNMENYYWQIKGRNGTVIEDQNGMAMVTIPQNTRIHVTIHNSMKMGMMNHPMHLHGQFFRLIKKTDTPEEAQERAFQHTATAFPGGDLELEFYSGYKGSWMFHCHNLYHMANSMMMAFRVEGDLDMHHGDSMPAKDIQMNMPMNQKMKEGVNSYMVDVGGGLTSQSANVSVALPDGNKALNQINFETERWQKPENEILSATGSFVHCYEPNKCVTLNLNWNQYLKNGEMIESTVSPGIGYSLKPFNNKILQANVEIYEDRSVHAELTSEIPAAPYTSVIGSVGCEGEYCKDLEAGFSVEIRPKLNLKLVPLKCVYKKAEGGTYCGAEVRYLFGKPIR